MASVSILDRTNKQGFRKTDILKNEKGLYFYNNIALGNKLPGQVLQSWQAFEGGPKDKKYALCSSGTYSFVSHNKNIKKQHEGCTDGDAYAVLIKNLEVVRKFAKERQ